MNDLGCAVTPTKDQVLLAAKALSDPVRLRIIEILAGARHRKRSSRDSGPGVCVHEFAMNLGLLQSLVSYHMKVLKEAGLVTDRRQGRWVHYSLNQEGFQTFQDELAGRLGL